MLAAHSSRKVQQAGHGRQVQQMDLSRQGKTGGMVRSMYQGLNTRSQQRDDQCVVRMRPRSYTESRQEQIRGTSRGQSQEREIRVRESRSKAGR